MRVIKFSMSGLVTVCMRSRRSLVSACGELREDWWLLACSDAVPGYCMTDSATAKQLQTVDRTGENALFWKSILLSRKPTTPVGTIL